MSGAVPRPPPLKPARGKLKIFLGAAPGVGKTYEMLLTARQRLAEGVDVVVGLVETHGRQDTARLLDGLEIIPPRHADHRGRIVEEMDLDAILARKPALVLVDELAHTNAPGGRHPKRHPDVEELIGAGIDVLTTLNIQHVESLNDVVARITRVRVREIVPDSVLDAADDVEVVDLAPDDLIRRLQEGKVYIPEQAQRALDKFFTRGNLTALRELALRRTAERVDGDLLAHMRSHAIRGPWPAGERMLVLVGSDPSVDGLVRYAKRAADRQRIPWIALHVETPRESGLPEAARDRVAEALRLAERLGGEAVTVPGGAIADDVIGFARERNATQIMVGKSHRSRWFELLHGSVVHDLLRAAGSIGVSVVAGDQVEKASAHAASEDSNGSATSGPTGIVPYIVSALTIVLATAIGELSEPLVGIETIDLIYIVGVVILASAYGRWPSLFASLAASLCYNYFFLPPIHTLTITDPVNVAAFIVFLAVALMVSQLASRVRAQVVSARSRARTTEALYGFSRKIAAASTLDDLLWAIAFQIASMLRLEVVMLLPEDGRLTLRAAYPPDDELDEADLGAARWAFDKGRPAGRGGDTLPGAKRLFVPIRTAQGVVGVAGLSRERPGELMTPEGRRLLDALLDQAAIAIERIALTRNMESARVDAETERLRSALLASLSHDLKTPLASILGAATSLRQYGALFDGAERADLVSTIESEAERMSRFVANLLDMSRLESGAIQIDRSPLDLADQIATARNRTAALLAQHSVITDIPADLPFIQGDATLLEQVLMNLLENAAKYTPADSTVSLRARQVSDGATLDILDEGPGLSPGDLDRIFEKYYRASDRDRRPAGAGLGLAISRGFMTALGGTITARNRTDRSGAVFSLHFPANLLVESPAAKEPVL